MYPYKLTAHANHCTVSSLILCDWYLFSKLKAINFLYEYSFQTCGKEETTKIEVVNEARTQLLTRGFEKVPVFQGSIDVNCYLSCATKPLILAFELNFELYYFELNF